MRRLLLLAVMLLLAAPAVASAATRYAAPAGSGDACTDSAPCDLLTALSAAADGDTVIVGTGTYDTPGVEYEDGSHDLTIRGAVTGPDRPVVRHNGFFLRGTSHVSDLQLETGDAAGVDLDDGSTADRIRSISMTSDGCTLRAGAVLTNSVCWSRAPSSSSGIASQDTSASTKGQPISLSHVTAVGQYGFYANADEPLVIDDSILYGFSYPDINFAYGQGSTLTRDNFDVRDGYAPTVTDQQSVPPAFVDLAGGDLRQAATSVTIGAGTATAGAQERDLDGNLRVLGTNSDIGAYERAVQTPGASTGTATGVTTSAATLAGTVDTQGSLTTWHFEYGPTATYGSTTPAIRVTADQDGAKSAPISELPSGQVVHYRLVATNDAGTTAGPDATFTTATEPSTPAPVVAPVPVVQPAPAKPPASRPTLSLKLRKGRSAGQLLLDRRTITLFVRCGSVACRATATGEVRLNGKRIGRLSAPNKALRLRAGKRGTIHLRSSKALRAKVRRALNAKRSRRAVVVFRATFRGSDGTVVKRTIRIKVRRLKR